MGLEVVPPGRIATIVTYLDMRVPPPPAPPPASPLTLRRWDEPDPERYRALFRRVGGPWLWFSRLALDDEGLRAVIRDPGISVHAAEDPAGGEVGLLELDHSVADECELAYFGLVPERVGQGHGRWLMAHALALAWRPGVTRVHVHTCTLDHPAALAFYRRSGFTPRGTAVESFADPRLAGLLDRELAPHVPIIE
ncbi:MAG: GNAT family N-acetyltransferase [Sphingomonadaceae bacterium]|nr:GNAT family N-acetyltransferase [Sphingomonadaceae bacterium]